MTHSQGLFPSCLAKFRWNFWSQLHLFSSLPPAHQDAPWTFVRMYHLWKVIPDNPEPQIRKCMNQVRDSHNWRKTGKGQTSKEASVRWWLSSSGPGEQHCTRSFRLRGKEQSEATRRAAIQLPDWMLAVDVSWCSEFTGPPSCPLHVLVHLNLNINKFCWETGTHRCQVGCSRSETTGANKAGN